MKRKWRKNNGYVMVLSRSGRQVGNVRRKLDDGLGGDGPPGRELLRIPGRWFSTELALLRSAAGLKTPTGDVPAALCSWTDPHDDAKRLFDGSKQALRCVVVVVSVVALHFLYRLRAFCCCR